MTEHKLKILLPSGKTEELTAEEYLRKYGV